MQIFNASPTQKLWIIFENTNSKCGSNVLIRNDWLWVTWSILSVKIHMYEAASLPLPPISKNLFLRNTLKNPSRTKKSQSKINSTPLRKHCISRSNNCGKLKWKNQVNCFLIKRIKKRSWKEEKEKCRHNLIFKSHNLKK